MESRARASERGRGRRYSRISLNLLREYRTVLSRRTDEDGQTRWTAKLFDVPGWEASGTTRTEALRRVREMSAVKGAPLGV